MKKYFAGLTAIAIAVVCFAFTSTKSTGPDCDTAHQWFKVKLSVTKECGSLLQGDFEPIIDPNQDGLYSVGEIPALLPEANPFGCQDVNTVACAVSFQATTSTTTSQVEVFQNPLDQNRFYFRPKVSALSAYKCCITRPIVE